MQKLIITKPLFDLSVIHPSWLRCIEEGLQLIDPEYRDKLLQSDNWLPGKKQIFNAFSIAQNKVNYILFGESPYPRRESANGYAFWDASVKELWSEKGLNKAVNRATSLRNIIKMLLIAEGILSTSHYRQEDIAKLDKNGLISTNQELFSHLLQHGFLLLNATLVLQNASSPRIDAKAWSPFIQHILACLNKTRPKIKLILFGGIAQQVFGGQSLPFDKLEAEHPYNLSFITNPKILDFFRPLHLLRAKREGEKVCYNR